MIESLLTDEEFRDVMHETIRHMNAHKRDIHERSVGNSQAACALAIATIIASCMNDTMATKQTVQTVKLLNSALAMLHQSWQLTPVV